MRLQLTSPRLFCAVLALSAFSLDACKKEAASPADAGPGIAPQLVYRSTHSMGTQVAITVYTPEEAKAVAAIEEAFTEFRRLDRLMTIWSDDSDVARINRAAGEAPVEVADDTFTVLTRAKEISELSSGKFDVTFGVLSGLWKFDHDQDDQIPQKEEVKKRLPLIGYERLVLDPKSKTAFLKDKGMRVHLGGIGKGYAVDCAVKILRARGFMNFMVQAGGDLYAAGKKGDRPWRVGVRDPRGPPSRFFAVMDVSNATFSTSGDYERSFIKDGVRYHHILDPDLGEPARLSRSVTILAPEAMWADGLSTAVFILGAERGMKLIEGMSNVGAVIVDQHNEVHISKLLRDRIEIVGKPSPGI